ncbi:hypothetical protein D3C72_472040 [compost metagenome]
MMLNRHLIAKMESILSPQHLFMRIASGALALALLSSCEALRPADVCLADETLATTKQILQQTILPRGDPALLQQAFDEVLTIELVTFEGYDRQTRRVSCSGRLASAESKLTAITYTRTPEVGTDRYIYGVNFEGNPAAPAYLLLSRYRELETQLSAPSADVAPHSPDHTSTEPQEAPRGSPAQAGDVDGFPLGHRSAGALLATLENVDTAAAIMTGRMTRASARRFCSSPSATQSDIEHCINEQIANNPGELIASANCQTREVLTSGGSPFRRVQGGWRNDQTQEVVADDDPPASGIFVIQTQFETLCPKATRALK